MVETLFEYAAARVEKGDTEAAVPLIQEGYDLALKAYGEKSFYTAVMLNLFGLVREYSGDLTGAGSFFQQAVDICRSLPDKNRSECSKVLMNLGTNLTTRKEYDAAEAVFHESLEQTRARYGTEHPSNASVLTHLGRMLMLKGDLGRSEERLREALGIYRRTLPAGHAEFPQTTSLLGLVLTREGKAREGEPLIREALEIRRKILPPDHWLIANLESTLGECLTKQKRFPEAEDRLLRAHEGLTAKLGEKHPRTIEAVQRLVTLYDEWHKPAEKEKYLALVPQPS